MKPIGLTPETRCSVGLAVARHRAATVDGGGGGSRSTGQGPQVDHRVVGPQEGVRGPQGVLRGGAYTTAERQELLASFRRHATAADRYPDAGFRLLLWNIGQMAREDDD